MAISITQEPALVTPSDNPIVFVFRQTISGKFKMSFVVDVNAGGSIGKFEVYPEFTDATYTYSKINISNIVAPYIPAQDLRPSTASTIFDPSGYRNIIVTVTEKYATTINGVPTTNASVSSSEIGVFKAKLSRSEFLNWDYTKYQKGLTKQLLTDRFYTVSSFNIYKQTVKKEDSFTFTWIDNDALTTPVNYKVQYNYYNGTTLITNYIENYLTTNQGLLGSVYFNLDYHVALGYLTSGQAATCTDVWIYLTNVSDTIISQFNIITFDKTCFFNGATLRFMNKYGAYDNYLFTYNKRYSASTKAFEVELPQGVWDNGSYYLSKTNTGRLNYLKQTTKKLELSSNWLDETTQSWLTQLYDSPAVYINENEDNESVIVTNSSYQIKQDKYDDLFNEVVEIEFTPENSIRL